MEKRNAKLVSRVNLKKNMEDECHVLAGQCRMLKETKETT